MHRVQPEQFIRLQEGDLGDSRRRRAAVDAAQDDSNEEEESSSSEDSASGGEEGPLKAGKLPKNSGEEVSDDEGKAMLLRYQQQKLLEASQVRTSDV